MSADPLMSPEFAAFLESGLSLTAASRDAELRVAAARAWAVRVDADRRRITLYVYEPAAADLLANLEKHPEIAVAIDRPVDHRACQLKGRFENSDPASPEDQDEIERQVEGFLSNLETLGIPREMTAGWLRWPCVAIRMLVTELYQQTPGPGAGERLRPGAFPEGIASRDGAA